MHLSQFGFYFCGMSFCFINNNHLTCLIICVLRFLTQLAILVKITVLLCDVVWDLTSYFCENIVIVTNRASGLIINNSLLADNN